MQQLSTAATAPPAKTHNRAPDSAAHAADMTSPKVTRALADIEAAKSEVDPLVALCLDAVADLVRETGDPDAVFDSILARIACEDVERLAAAHGLRLCRSTEESVDDGTVTEVVLCWPTFAILPHGQEPRTSRDQLRAAIAERLEEERLGAAFQASVAAGPTEDVDTWHARTAQAAR